MNKTPWLVLDCDGLAHRAWHAMKGLSHNGMETGALFGVMRDIEAVQDRFNTDKIMFCFDHGSPNQSVRRQFCPKYKANRDRTGKEGLYRQIKLLKTKILTEAGFNKVFYQLGYEADDWLGLISKTCCEESFVLVTRDHDMHQLLTKDKRVIVYDPQTKQEFDYQGFVAKWGIEPRQLPELMSWTGCKTDNIDGIPGVGPILAKQIVLGEAMPERIARKISDFITSGQRAINEKLITLPWPGLNVGECRPDTVTQAKWNAVCEQHGMESLIPRCPRISKED